MANITALTYLDGGTARTAGEAMTINGSTAELIVRTDTRVHANAPAANAGSLSSVTFTEGKLTWDGTKVRWLAYAGGTGNVPPIGATISGDGTSTPITPNSVTAITLEIQSTFGTPSGGTGYACIGEVEFYDSNNVKISNTGISVVASSTYTTWAASRVLDGGLAYETQSWCSDNSPLSSFLYFTCSTPKPIAKVRIINNSNTQSSLDGEAPKDVLISFTHSVGGATFISSTRTASTPSSYSDHVVPAATTSSGVSGYSLGVWSSVAAAQTAVGAAMPATGFIKLREVTGGSFSAGALTGIGASATGADVEGWIEVVHDATSNFTIPRLGEHRARGGRFYLGTTNGIVGQTFQTPAMGSSTCFAPGVFIEKTIGSANTDDDYEIYPALNDVLNGWSQQHIGDAVPDKRQSFCKALSGGILQLGEAHTQSCTYASIAAQSSTYAGIAHASTYTWANDKVTVTYATGHQLDDGQQTGLDFTTGACTADGIYTVTVLDPYRFEVSIAGSGTGGNVTSRPGITITFSGHVQNIGDSVRCDFTTGSGVDGTYNIYLIASSTAYAIKYPSAAPITSGNVSCLHTLTVTTPAAHDLAIGNNVSLDFTSGAGVDGVYTIKTVPSTTTFTINMPHSAAITSSNVTLRRTIGYVPPAGLRVWIPNIIVQECTTAARATNTIPNATIASRPEWTTTSAGAIDFENVYLCSGYLNLNQSYKTRLKNVLTWDTLVLTEQATKAEVINVATGMYGGLDTLTLNLTSNFAGALIKNSKFERGNAPGANDHACTINYCKDIELENTQFGIIQYVRASGVPLNIANTTGIKLTNCRTINGRTVFGNSQYTVINQDYCDRYNGATNITSGTYAIDSSIGCINSEINGVTFGFGGEVENSQPQLGVVLYNTNINGKIRNLGTYANPLPTPSFAPNLTSIGYIVVTNGNNNGMKIQRCYSESVRTSPASTVNSDKNMTFEQVMGGMYVYANKSVFANTHAELNGVIKGNQEINSVLGQASVYGTHWLDIFLGKGYGRIILAFNEPTIETTAQFTMVSGIAKFNSAGGLLLPTIGNQCMWEMPYFAKGHTGFENTVATMSGGTIGNYTLEFQYDIGGGYNGSWLILNGTNLSAITVTPSIGVKLKVRITTLAPNTTAITFLRLDTTTSEAAQSADLYPLDTINLTLSGMVNGTDIVILAAGTETVLATQEDINGGYYTFVYEVPQYVDIRVFKEGYYPANVATNYLLNTYNSTILVNQTIDPSYLN